MCSKILLMVMLLRSKITACFTTGRTTNSSCLHFTLISLSFQCAKGKKITVKITLYVKHDKFVAQTVFEHLQTCKMTKT